ncbi:hypothetical protein ACFQU9_16990 [Actinomadura namibiensis]|uniref:Uncharacterized protein n=1 Tax=Actinomadura namibiensis TaxID=182080 RepID=A0A7W3LRY3_ACTNM|nr:hypothetical protein [Actinomadura namibiensis]MBA8953154.1 hypothetical protein [Actinomadura namibiensis]
MELIERWRQIVIKSKPWGLFAYGTCLFVPNPVDDLETHSIEVLREHGTVPDGRPARSFGIIDFPLSTARAGRSPGFILASTATSVLMGLSTRATLWFSRMHNRRITKTASSYGSSTLRTLDGAEERISMSFWGQTVLVADAMKP